jgi:hypothetical protein
MRFSIWVTGIVLLVQLFLCLTPFIPITAHYWHTEEPQQFYEVFATLIGVQLVLLTAAITMILIKESNDARERIENVAATINGTVVRPLKDYEFYQHFRNSVERAHDSVWIAYLAPYPPAEVASVDRKKYDNEIISLMKHNPKIKFRRLIRYSEKNLEWIKELADTLRQRPNVDIRVLTQDLSPDKHEMPLTLSVQIIDNDKVWIVATGSHETERHFRDVYIENEDVAAAMIEYYDRIWNISSVVLDHGRENDDLNKLLKS